MAGVTSWENFTCSDTIQTQFSLQKFVDFDWKVVSSFGFYLNLKNTLLKTRSEEEKEGKQGIF